jgi:hypothetical protein
VAKHRLEVPLSLEAETQDMARTNDTHETSHCWTARGRENVAFLPRHWLHFAPRKHTLVTGIWRSASSGQVAKACRRRRRVDEA